MTGEHVGDAADRHFSATLPLLEQPTTSLFGSTPRGYVVDTCMRRPFSTVYRVMPQGVPAAARLFVKIARPRHDTREEFDFMSSRVSADYQLTRELYEAMSGHDGLGVVQPVACFPEHLALVTVEAPGETLLRWVEQRGRWWPRSSARDRLTGAASRVGAWLRAFQAVRPPGSEIVAEALQEYLDVRLQRLVSEGALSGRDRSRILARAAELHRAVPAADRQSVAVHGDFALGNTLVDDRSVTVLDLAMANTGPRHLDLTQVYMQFGLMQGKPQFRPATINALQSALLAGFDPALTPAHPLFQLMYLQHTACHLLTLTVKKAGLLERAYNARLIARHRAWLRRFSAAATTAAR